MLRYAALVALAFACSIAVSVKAEYDDDPSDVKETAKLDNKYGMFYDFCLSFRDWYNDQLRSGINEVSAGVFSSMFSPSLGSLKNLVSFNPSKSLCDGVAKLDQELAERFEQAKKKFLAYDDSITNVEPKDINCVSVQRVTSFKSKCSSSLGRWLRGDKSN